MENGNNGNIRYLNRFQYHLEDTDCKFCLYWKGIKHGCMRIVCCCEDIKYDILAHGRIKRPRPITCPE